MDADEFAGEAVGLHERVARVVMATCGDRTIAEECAAEALLRSWERVDRGEELRSLEAWTMTVALNASRTRVRRNGAERRALEKVAAAAPPEHPGSGPESASDRPAEHVMAAVLALPERQRQVVALHYLDDMSTDDIANVIGTTAGAVRNALHHARSTLAVVLDTGEPDRQASR